MLEPLHLGRALAGGPLAVYDVSSTPFKKKEQLCLKRISWQAKEFL